MPKTNEHRCLLRNVCANAGKLPACTARCDWYVILSGRVAAAGVPVEYRLRTLADVEINETIRKYAGTLARQHEIDDSTPPADRIKSLYLWSANPGTGKTTTACVLLNAWIVEHCVGTWRRGKQPKQAAAYFLDVNEFQSRYNLATMTNDTEDLERIKSEIKRAQVSPFAVLDDVGVRSTTDAFRGYLHAIVNYRVTNGLPTVYTSNLPIKDLPRVFGEERLADRMRDMCVEIEFMGESKRGMRR